jgi:hypothetical protein
LALIFRFNDPQLTMVIMKLRENMHPCGIGPQAEPLLTNQPAFGAVNAVRSQYNWSPYAAF